MQQVEFKALGRRVSCLGFGCAGLDGRLGLRRSTKLLETALKLGITYFDVAPSYGTAEEAIGHVIGNSKEVVIATKVGPPRRPYDLVSAYAKSVLKPNIDRIRRLKILLRGVVAPPRNQKVRPRYDFSYEALNRSIETSLKHLQRDHIDVFLAHEPHREDLVPEVEERFQSLVNGKTIGAFGVGIGAREDSWTKFGSIWQSAWPADHISTYDKDISYLFHRVIHNAAQDRFGQTQVPVPKLIQAARRQSPNSVLIVSASTPKRLEELVNASELME
ncbi:aldo/keto reductase [Adhaeretor mobilis]|uniref:Pyridoxal 4-dehydrogenase n=1 Tax=Adhaeretor mobilis TaxID=1930276 RepID=A0A517MYL9_9BACT|nr:aldo/keto reductase [Adhaeretor mobilis]QDS99990.1 Pyridoxal 4-dehydrogenase [Adhaeretor mobilis]